MSNAISHLARFVDQVPYGDSCVTNGEWRAASSVSGRGEMTSFSWEQMRVWALRASWEVDSRVACRICQ